MSRDKTRERSLGDAVKWDGVYRGSLEGTGEETRSRAFRSTRLKRYEFKKQDKRDYQDDEDLVDEMDHLKLVSRYKDLSGALDILVKGFEEVTEPTVGEDNCVKKPKRKKIKLYYEDEDDDDNTLDIKLKSVDSKMKFQKHIPRTMQFPTKPITDPIYKSFIKTQSPEKLKTEVLVPEDYKPRYTLTHSNTKPLSKTAASSLLNSRFTTSNTESESEPKAQSKDQSSRTVLKIEVSPLLRKRLGL